MNRSRRDVLGAVAGLAGSALGAPAAQAQAQAPVPAPDPGARLQIVMLAYPDMTALDLVAPQLVFATLGHADVQLVWKDTEPVTTDSGLRIVPTTRIADAARAPDVLFVPGGLKGTTALLRDTEVLQFVQRCGEASGWVTSVCTGALLLGAAGLLRGYRATSHWYVRDLLPLLDATPVNQRVVRDRNRVTGAGVTAGMDMALALSALLRGEGHARRQQLVFEYAPQPPFNSGTPEEAGVELSRSVRLSRQAAIEAARQAVAQLLPIRPAS